MSVTVAFDYQGFPAGHQDVLFAVVAAKGAIGRVESQNQYPFEWAGSGCATVTIPLKQPLAPATDYRLVAFVGPNYELRAFASNTFTVGEAGAPPQG
ncbi:MAG TPA: hypothetical protein VF855_06805 [Acidimicrobiales bacterium]